MFTKHNQEPTFFASSWKTEQSITENSSQTEPLETKEEESQVLETTEIGIQTDKEETPDYKNVNYDESSLLEFLHRITPQVEKELSKACRSRAFDSYSDLDEESNTGVKCVHTLRWQQILPEHSVIDIGWSSTGSLISIGYGVRLHDDWCSHKGAVAVWNINRNDFAANQPDQLFDIATCVTCIEFHPQNPAILAVGNMAGEVMVFDLAKTQEALPTFRADSGGVSISGLKWVSLPTSGNTDRGVQFKSSLSLVSITAEGTILVWAIHYAKEDITLSSGYLVKTEDIPRELRSRLSDAGGVGLTCVTFGYDDTSRFLLGTEGGAVLTCSTLLMPNKPVCVIYNEEEMTCSQWSPSRPLVVAVGKIGGEISFYNFANKNCAPILSLPAPEKSSPISTLKFNKNNMKLLACGDHLGRVFIWQLPVNFISPSAFEQNTLADLVQISAE
ncbi:WD repeat-containing protein 34 [Armadillidium nasatum]|uniref:WD repeat-containing protein 34 n=1 Tax=Armadillidium nasatum TaxID=96803 RepID=A0A5N5SVG9_9CRUS|nr:WD repeat-containing protein 34 [Armadillidium nasatum]